MTSIKHGNKNEILMLIAQRVVPMLQHNWKLMSSLTINKTVMAVEENQGKYNQYIKKINSDDMVCLSSGGHTALCTIILCVFLCNYM